MEHPLAGRLFVFVECSVHMDQAMRPSLNSDVCPPLSPSFHIHQSSLCAHTIFLSPLCTHFFLSFFPPSAAHRPPTLCLFKQSHPPSHSLLSPLSLFPSSSLPLCRCSLYISTSILSNIHPLQEPWPRLLTSRKAPPASQAHPPPSRHTTSRVTIVQSHLSLRR